MTHRSYAYALFVFAFLLRVTAALVLHESQVVLPDSREYLAVADNARAGKGFVLDETAQAKRPPGYPAFLVPFRAVFGGGLLPIQIAQALLGGLSCVLVFLLGMRLLDRPAAALASLAAAVYPMLVFTGAAILIEALHATLVLLEIWFLTRAERHWAWGLAAGVSGGLGALVHAGHVLFFVAVLLAVRRPRLLPYAAVFLFVVGLWTWRNAVVLGRFVPISTAGGYGLYEAFGPEANGGTVGHRMVLPDRGSLSEVDYDALLRREALSGLTPARFAKLALEKQRRFWSVVPHAGEYRSLPAYVATLCFVPVLVFWVAGLWKWRRGAGLLLVPVVYYAALHCVFIGSIRYRLVAEPFLLLIAAWGAKGLFKSRTRSADEGRYTSS